ncbi:MAG: hypothetical protein WA431_07415 [Candidatus Cybelea sp.]
MAWLVVPVGYVEPECANVGSAHDGVVACLHLATPRRFIPTRNLGFPLRRPLPFVQVRRHLAASAMADAVI